MYEFPKSHTVHLNSNSNDNLILLLALPLTQVAQICVPNPGVSNLLVISVCINTLLWAGIFSSISFWKAGVLPMPTTLKNHEGWKVRHQKVCATLIWASIMIQCSSPWLHSKTLPTFYTFAGKPNPAYKPFHYIVPNSSQNWFSLCTE